MFISKTIAVALISALFFVSAPPSNADNAIKFGSNEPTVADGGAIRQMLAAYTAAVSAGDEARFKRLLLNEQIPFTGVGSTITSDATKPFDDKKFSDFDQTIFKSGVKYEQAFYNVHILQDGPLAQVSLDFVTKESGTGRGGWGWKILHLVKVNGDWKIASEFYTGHPLPRT